MGVIGVLRHERKEWRVAFERQLDLPAQAMELTAVDRRGLSEIFR